jgi:hypothetical protein
VVWFGTTIRQRFLWGQFPGYITRARVAASVSWWPRKEEGNLEFGSNQDSVGKGCQKSGCGRYRD